MSTGYTRSSICPSQQRCAARQDPEAQRIQTADVRQVPRIGVLGKRPHPARPFDQWPPGWGSLSTNVIRAVRISSRQSSTTTRRWPLRRRTRTSLPDRHRGSCHRMDQGTETQSRQAVLRLLPRAGTQIIRCSSRRRGATSRRASSIRAGTSIAEEILARSSAFVPYTQLTPKAEIAPDWDKLSADEKKVCIRYQESSRRSPLTFEIGRVVQAVDDVAHNTLIIYVTGDNGASSEWRTTGAFNERFQPSPREAGIPAQDPR